ncbi:hypothetical protein JCM33374_g825 [Metschnikowia sp. JCM 33374]|nr:hypothetical protein JCM33374_g825 [Metschnikowia sp. JCM 33374]
METPKEVLPQDIEIYNSQVDIHNLPIFTRSQLRRYNGQDRPQIFVAIKGYIYDVTNNKRNYGVGKSYHKLVGKDVSRLLGLNRLQLKPTDSSGDRGIHDIREEWEYSDFTEKQNQALEKWIIFFKKRYKIVGVVVDHQMHK